MTFTKEQIKQAVFQFFQEHNLLYEGLQRVWEVNWAIDRLPKPTHLFAERSLRQTVLFDTGCGNDARYAKIFAKAGYCVYCNDPEPYVGEPIPKIQYIVGTTQSVVAHTTAKIDVDCVTCISVLEHIEDKEGFCKALDSIAAPILLTLEYCPDPNSPMASSLLTLTTLTQCLQHFTNHYVSTIDRCPVYAFNSPTDWYPLAIELLPNR